MCAKHREYPEVQARESLQLIHALAVQACTAQSHSSVKLELPTKFDAVAINVFRIAKPTVHAIGAEDPAMAERLLVANSCGILVAGCAAKLPVASCGQSS